MRRVAAVALLVAIVALGVLTVCMVANAEEATEYTPVKITGYCLHGTMANGETTREGVCAYRKEDIGRVARVYNANMELMGEYEICDTGKGGVRKGTVVDIWKETKRECFALTQHGFIQVVDKEEEQQ